MKRYLTLLPVLLVVTLLAAAFPTSSQLVAAPAKQETPAATEAAAAGFDPAVCFRADKASDKEISMDAKKPPFKIGVSNSFIGNSWRTQMIQMATAYGQSTDGKALISDLTIVSSGR